jgi:hypothetical protein
MDKIQNPSSSERIVPGQKHLVHGVAIFSDVYYNVIVRNLLRIFVLNGVQLFTRRTGGEFKLVGLIILSPDGRRYAAL